MVDAAPWVCREAIAPRVRRDDGGLWTETNGSEGCYGGWTISFPVTARAGDEFRFRIEADGTALARGADELFGDAIWIVADGTEVDWEPLLLEGAARTGGTAASDGEAPLRATWVARLRYPSLATATRLQVRFGLRWSSRGRVRWHDWRLEPVARRSPRVLRLGAASGRPERAIDGPTNAAHYLAQCRRAGEAGVDLLCLPEIILTWNLRLSRPEEIFAAAVPVPGPWLEPFQDVARRYKMGICLSVYERAGAAGELVYNTGVLLGRDGDLVGKYRKVHLAIGEVRGGITAGHEFPVFAFDGVTVGINICMDSAAAESARVLAVKGAEVMLMPIVNDFRATQWERWDHGKSVAFDEERWQLIQRIHAFEHHLYVVAAKNVTRGSAIAAPWGEIVAYNAGDRELIAADVDLDDRRKHALGSSIQAVLAAMRRPVTYHALTDASAPAGPAPLR
jgi:predicted amidohydrolase